MRESKILPSLASISHLQSACASKKISTLVDGQTVRRTAIFFTSNECSVAEHTIIWRRLPSGVTLGIWL